MTQQVEWKDAENPKGVYYFDDLDKIVNAAQAHNIKIMLSVVKAPSWETGGFNGLPEGSEGHIRLYESPGQALTVVECRRT